MLHHFDWPFQAVPKIPDRVCLCLEYKTRPGTFLLPFFSWSAFHPSFYNKIRQGWKYGYVWPMKQICKALWIVNSSIPFLPMRQFRNFGEGLIEWEKWRRAVKNRKEKERPRAGNGATSGASFFRIKKLSIGLRLFTTISKRPRQ